MTLNPGTLLILDGWGHAPPESGNAIAAARTPTLDGLAATHPRPLLAASGAAVGLPDGVVGNSEIGHLVIGAGRPLEYDSLLVARQVDSGELRDCPLLREACATLAATGGALHLVGLCSDGRIHSDIAHFGELLRAATNAGVHTVWIHAITDGRDVTDGTAEHHLVRLTAIAAEAGAGAIATVVGRNYAMDKSGKAELTAKACALLLDGAGERSARDAVSAVRQAGGDAGLAPTTIAEATSVRDGDVILFANFRSDRTAPLVDMACERLAATGRAGVRLLSLTQYDTRAPVSALVPRTDASGGLADALEAAGARSVRIAEQEKFEHVTFFINGRDSRPRLKERRVRVPTAAGDRYVSRPEMNLAMVARHVVASGARDDVDLVVANLANMDVVGHTGDYGATVLAAEAVDRAVQQICAAARSVRRWVLLVGDHGNAEQMYQSANGGVGKPYGGHTHNPVPCVLVPSGDERLITDQALTLPSVGPTALHLLGIPVPPTMSAPSLLAAGRPVDVPTWANR
jgi:2,3-bisphosphoglycerate-independent phosphoglycerate mutase